MVYKIKNITPLKDFKLLVDFENVGSYQYDMLDDINTLPRYDELKKIDGLFNQVKIDQSRTIVYWNDYIDLPSDILLQYGKKL